MSANLLKLLNQRTLMVHVRTCVDLQSFKRYHVIRDLGGIMFPLQTNPDPLGPFYYLKCFEIEQVNPVSIKKLMKNENTAHTIMTADVYFSASILNLVDN